MTTPLPAEWASWVEVAARLIAAPPLRRSEVSTRGPEDKKFALGDWLLSVPAELVDRLATELGQEPAAFRAYRDVAQKVPASSRVQAAWSVHRDLKDKPHLLKSGLTVREAALLAGKKPIDSKASHRVTVGEKAELVRELLSDKDVAAIIESERVLSRDERRARQAARNFTSETAAKAKLLEAELREAKQAKSPYEATIRVLLDLHKGAQVADGVGDLADQLDQPDRIVDALRSMITAATAALEKFSVDVPFTIDGEGTWQDRPEAYGLAESAQRPLSPAGRVIDHQG